MCRWIFPAFIFLMFFRIGEAQVGEFKFGGIGERWSLTDSSEVFIDFESFPGSIAPVYFNGADNILDQLPYWSPFKFPTELGYEDGLTPRVWRAANGFYWFTAGTLTTEWVDGDSSSYSPPVARGITSEWYTFDVGVPVPADVVGFYTPPAGFRADGTPLRDDIFKAFEVSIAEEFDPVMNLEDGDSDYHTLETLVADIPLNYESNVQLDFPKQYVRFIRLQRKPSSDDKTFASGQANVQQGTIGEFELKGSGVPRRVIFVSKIIDVGELVNFGKIYWSATGMRFEDGLAKEVDDSQASLSVEMRSGRDPDPNIYFEYTDTGAERVVSRSRYENELKQRDQNSAGAIQSPKPGLRASVAYDQENWTYWSFPFSQSGIQAPLARGSHIQLRITLESQSFFDFIRLDSLWIETSPPLARQVIGEVARMDDSNPSTGLTEVALGDMTDFIYEISSSFDVSGQNGFDALRIRTGSPTVFKNLYIGLDEVEPKLVKQEDDLLTLIFPRRITRQANEPVRVIFGAEVFVFANTFSGEVFDTKSSNLPQQIEAGNASETLGTDNLRVFGGSAQRSKIIEEFSVGSGFVTPNGDGINDLLSVDYVLYRLPSPIPVMLNAYDLQGRLIRRIDGGLQGAGRQQIFWDGSREDGNNADPGIYIIELALISELKTFRIFKTVSVAY